MNKNTDERYPYTYAADYLRGKVGGEYGTGTEFISRSAAAQIVVIIAEAIGVEAHAISCKLADAFIKEKN